VVLEEAEKYAHINEAARYLAGHYLPGALTLVLKKKETVPSLLVAGLSTVGIRMPDNKVMLQLVAKVGKPLTTTSANISGKPTPYAADEITANGRGIRGAMIDQGPLPGATFTIVIYLSRPGLSGRPEHGYTRC
jgi:L-threonylcarbamoyladenylate synthase